jgi:hypothetical protein
VGSVCSNNMDLTEVIREGVNLFSVFGLYKIQSISFSVHGPLTFKEKATTRWPS